MKEHFDLRFTVYNLRAGRLGWLICWLCLSLATLPVAFAQLQKSVPPVVVRDDRTPLTIRKPQVDHLRDLQTDHDYQYGRDAPPPENPIARFFQWLFQKFGEFLRSEAYQNVWQYVILAAVAGFVIYLLMKAEVMKFLFPKGAESISLDYENLAENIHEINFDAAVEEAVTNRNFRLATRLLYLQTLKRLTDAGRITYKPDKTNRQYVYELANSPLQTDFETLTRQFEFVWYGDFPIDESRFGQLRQQFRQFNQPVAHQS
ncbi:DUF4129 domain-containing protein [Spirosoma sp. KCTC 42546]|uniref:DUF4129 domain-containing protein n=1 Tax=Spirosoma sp. KCTC 42546 TaxID=2520506 RepID=UPI00115B69CD|nr:DUF4129 domain-containing protein [Spirosoma sp. KCTC 42546]QDK83120.1 DUF4129 domain-containing protein [Spirosoma sp. KCTC 42546]